jgi:hypothetical protein
MHNKATTGMSLTMDFIFVDPLLTMTFLSEESLGIHLDLPQASFLPTAQLLLLEEEFPPLDHVRLQELDVARQLLRA